VTTTLNRLRPNPAGDSLRLSVRRPKRRPLLAIGSLALVTVCAASFLSLYVRAGGRTSVLAVTRSVPAGQNITAGDLAIVRVSLSPGLSVINAASLDQVVGRRAAVQLEPGDLLSPSDLSNGAGLPPGDAIVGVATKPGQVPANGVQPGDRVDVVLTAVSGVSPSAVDGSSVPSGTSASAQGLPGSLLAQNATVTEVSTEASSDGTTVVSLMVSSAVAPAIASASTSGSVALVLVDPGS
jgi:Flp pilus assembly protein CpaB